MDVCSSLFSSSPLNFQFLVIHENQCNNYQTERKFKMLFPRNVDSYRIYGPTGWMTFASNTVTNYRGFELQLTLINSTVGELWMLICIQISFEPTELHMFALASGESASHWWPTNTLCFKVFFSRCNYIICYTCIIFIHISFCFKWYYKNGARFVANLGDSLQFVTLFPILET